jgi:hypothetical protein
LEHVAVQAISHPNGYEKKKGVHKDENEHATTARQKRQHIVGKASTSSYMLDDTSANYGLSAQYCTESVVVHSACSGCRDVYDFHRSTRVLLQCYHRLHAGF